jgi:ATP-dependent DNA helicase RecG
MNFKSKKESETLEFKKSTGEWKEIIETASAFSNTRGGEILVGINNNGEVKGIEIGKDTIERLTNKIAQNTDPKIHPRITTEKINGKFLIVIEIKESSDHLVLAFGRPYKRVGKSTVRMSKDEYERLVLEKHKDKLRFDNQVCKHATLEDIDWDLVTNIFIPKYESLTETKLVGNQKELLEALNCIIDDNPTRAGVLLFGKNPQKIFENAYIAMARYKGKEVGVERLDYKEFNGNLFHQIDECDKYIKEHIAIMSRLLPYKVEREDIPEYPLFSIRELVTNAVVHRDYAIIGSKVIIKMFDNKIEFYNPGGLPSGITPENITNKQFSRNPILTRVLSKIGYIEELGEGWDKIIKEHKNHTLIPKLPKIEADTYSVLVEIFSTRDKFEKEKMEEEKAELNQRQKKALEYIKKRGKISNAEYRSIFKVSAATAKRELKDLVIKKICRTSGAGPSLHYLLKI